jgi:DNA (cytosine-5)-methyltransferase 1
MRNSFKFIDLFAGIGGMRLAFEAIGGTCVFSSEIDRFAQKTYTVNFGEVPRGDITKILTDTIPEHDILTAGFPCQPFSSIGKREGFKHETQGTLFYEIVRILATKRPLGFLLENVEGLLNHNEGKTFTIIKATLLQLKYDIYFQVLNAADYQVPQNRRRIYIVGINRDILNKHDFNFPEPIGEKVGIGKFVEQNIDGYEISQHLQSVYMFKKDDGRPELIDETSNFPVKTLVSTYHKIQRLTGTFVKDGKTGMRLLSERECKAIMGFPDTFIVPVSRTQMYRQFGNAVAIPVVIAIANEMKRSIIDVAFRQTARV